MALCKDISLDIDIHLNEKDIYIHLNKKDIYIHLKKKLLSNTLDILVCFYVGIPN